MVVWVVGGLVVIATPNFDMGFVFQGLSLRQSTAKVPLHVSATQCSMSHKLRDIEAHSPMSRMHLGFGRLAVHVFGAVIVILTCGSVIIHTYVC